MDDAATRPTLPAPPDAAAAPAADPQGVLDAAGKALALAAAEPALAAALLGAEVLTLRFAPDGGIEVDVDGTVAAIDASELLDDEPADGASAAPPPPPPAG